MQCPNSVHPWTFWFESEQQERWQVWAGFPITFVFVAKPLFRVLARDLQRPVYAVVSIELVLFDFQWLILLRISGTMGTLITTQDTTTLRWHKMLKALLMIISLVL